MGAHVDPEEKIHLWWKQKQGSILTYVPFVEWFKTI